VRELSCWYGAEAASPSRVLCSGGVTHTLLTVTARALDGRDCGDVGYPPSMSRFGVSPAPWRRRAAQRVAGRDAVPVGLAGHINANRVAEWVVAQYPRRDFAGAVLGSPHGGAAHLAAALGVPWLPSSFDVVVRWPEGSADDPAAAVEHGGKVVRRMLAANPGVLIRQVHDPAVRGVQAGCTVALNVRWRWLPEAYRGFLSTHLAAGGPVLVLRDARTWPVLHVDAGHTFQLGSPASGLEPADFLGGSPHLHQVLRYLGGDRTRWRAPRQDCPEGYAETGVEPSFEDSLRAWACGDGRRLHRVLFARPEALSAAIADVYRRWLRAAGKTGDRLVVECGRLLDPTQVIRAGLVPYWCETAVRRTVAGAEWWLAGSARFSSVDVLVESPGVDSIAVASLPQWQAVARFGARRAVVDPVAAREYPLYPLPTKHATRVLRGQPHDLPRPPPLRFDSALESLRDNATGSGLLMC
jgi:hypothetical protein